MTMLTRWRSMVAWVWHRDRAERGLDAELRAYVDLSAAEKERSGLSPAEARRQAMLELGSIESVKEHVRRGRHGGVLDEVWRDLRQAARLLLRGPGFTAVVIVTLALGIGANTAIFSVVDALLLRSLPVREPQQLVEVALTARNAPAAEAGGSQSLAIVQLLAAQRDIFASVGGFNASRFDVGPPDAVVRVPAAVVTGGFYETLGLEARAGRLLGPADDVPGAPAAAVISDGYWDRQFGRAADAVGRTLLIGGTPVPIVGVTPRGFAGATVGATADVTLTAHAFAQVMPANAPLLQPGNFWLRVLARPRDGVSMASATARLGDVWRHEAEGVIPSHWPASQRADLAAQVFRVSPGGTGWSYLRTVYRTPLVVLMAIVGVVLLIASANVASLLLARASARRREMSLRLALGASRGRIIQQLLTEGLLLALAGGALGTGLAWLASRALVLLMSTRNLPIDIDVTPNARILGFTAAVSIGTAVLFSLVPAIQATAAGPARALSTGTRASRTRSRWLPALVSAQVALALVLLAGASLFARTLANVERVDAGFDAADVVIAELDARAIGARDVAGMMAALPGVTVAAIATDTPLDGWSWSEPFVPAGQPLPERDTALVIGAGPGYFTALGIRILSGRAFEAGDRAGSQPVAVVNDAFARQVFPGQAVVGQRLTAKVRGTPMELRIVGVAANTRTAGLRQAPPKQVYLAFAQLPGQGRAHLIVRGTGGVGRLAATIDPVLRAAQPGAPVEIEPLASQVRSTIVQERVLAMLATGFGLLALLLTIVGLYGVVAYGVAQRTQELGVRLALGARRAQVIRLVLGDGARLVAIGVVAGLPAAWLASRWVRTLLFGVAPADPASAGVAVGVLTVAAVVAAYLPARQAARTDPLVALRHE